MRESISITTIFQIFILFILLFTAIMCLTINNSNAFGVKDSIINVIEANDGKYLDGANLSQDIVDVIAETSYRTSGKCPEVENSDNQYQGFDRSGNAVSRDSDNAAVCIRKVKTTEEMDTYLEGELGVGSVATEDFVEGVYYQVVVFFQLDIPVFKQVYNFKTKGETRIIYNTEKKSKSTSVNSNIVDKNELNNNQNSENVKNTTTGQNSGNSENTTIGQNSSNNNVVALNEVCTEGVEGINYSLKSIQAITFHSANAYVNYNRTGDKFSVEPGVKYKIIGEDSTGKYWAIDYQGKCGWVDNTRMGIDAKAYISNANFNITNASASIFKMLGKSIPNVTGKKLYNSEFTIAPLQYHFAKKVKQAAQNATNAGYTLVIYETYRPQLVSSHVATNARDFINNNADVRNAFRGKSLSNYIASGGSLHNKGCAVDVTISGVTMPTEIHELTPAANGTNSYTELLDKFFLVGQVKGLNSEWWHFESTQNCLSDATFWSAV